MFNKMDQPTGDRFSTEQPTRDRFSADQPTGDRFSAEPISSQETSNVSKMTLGMGITSGLLSLAALTLGIYTFISVGMTSTSSSTSNSTEDFTSAEVSTLQNFTNQMTFTPDDYLLAKGFTDDAGFSSVTVAKTVNLAATIDIGTTVDSGTWAGQPISSTRGGLGTTSNSPYEVLIGGGSLPPTASGDFLMSQGIGVSPMYNALPSFANGEIDGNFANLFGLAWNMQPPPLCYYTVIGNVVVFSGTVVLRVIGGPPKISPALTYNVFGTPLMGTVVKGTRSLTNTSLGVSYPVDLGTTFCRGLQPNIISGFAAGNNFVFDFTIAYEI